MTDLAEIAEFLRSERVTRTALSDGSGVVLDVKGLAVYSLNETGMFLVNALCEGAADADALVARLVVEFEVDEATARADVATFTEQLAKVMKP
ncbi:MAG TPA: PqqD family protein [Thermoanaerobaculaceae bacterium]|nr:PqqD family protein [Thermoanaerobaculaceae bacterium]